MRTSLRQKGHQLTSEACTWTSKHNGGFKLFLSRHLFLCQTNKLTRFILMIIIKIKNKKSILKRTRKKVIVFLKVSPILKEWCTVYHYPRARVFQKYMQLTLNQIFCNPATERKRWNSWLLNKRAASLLLCDRKWQHRMDHWTCQHRHPHWKKTKD